MIVRELGNKQNLNWGDGLEAVRLLHLRAEHLEESTKKDKSLYEID